MIRHRRLAAFLATVLLSPALPATDPLNLTGPEIVKLDWGARSLCVGDINNDGLPDLAVANNDRATEFATVFPEYYQGRQFSSELMT